MRKVNFLLCFPLIAGLIFYKNAKLFTMYFYLNLVVITLKNQAINNFDG